MALWKFTNLNKHGNYRSRIIHTKGALSIPGSGFGPTIFANRFKYEYKDQAFPPTIANIGGKTYLMPLWKEVDPNTTIDDINWIKYVLPLILAIVGGKTSPLYSYLNRFANIVGPNPLPGMLNAPLV